MTFREMLRMRGIRYRENKSHPSEITICCPFCIDRGQTEDVRYRLGINLANQKGHCFNCDWRSQHALSFVARKLGETSLLDDATEGVEAPPLPPITLPEGWTSIRGCDATGLPLYRQPRQYLRNRGLTEAQIDGKNLGACFIGKYAYRIIFPLLRQDRLVGFVGRDFTGTSPIPYMNSTGEKFFYNAPPDCRNQVVIVSEGVFDALSIERAMAPPVLSVASLSHSITELQEEWLSEAKGICFFLDRDIDARFQRLKPDVLGYMEIAHRLALLKPVMIAVAQRGVKDAGEMGPKAIRHQLDKRLMLTPLLDLRLRALTM